MITATILEKNETCFFLYVFALEWTKALFCYLVPGEKETETKHLTHPLYIHKTNQVILKKKSGASKI